MSNTSSGVLILLVALLLDLGGIGPSSVRDRIAVVFAACGSYALWSNTPAVDAVAGAVRDGIRSLMITFGARPGPSDPALIVTALVSALAFVMLLALWFDAYPDDATTSEGRPRSAGLRALASRVTLECRHDRRLNPRVWFLGVPVGALAPLAGGLVGTGLQGALAAGPSLIAAAINMVFVGGPA